LLKNPLLAKSDAIVAPTPKVPIIFACSFATSFADDAIFEITPLFLFTILSHAASPIPAISFDKGDFEVDSIFFTWAYFEPNSPANIITPPCTMPYS